MNFKANKILLRIGVLVGIFLLIQSVSYAQDSSFIQKNYHRYFNKYVKVDSCLIDRDSGKAVSRHDFPVPVFGFSQEKKVVIGLALIYSFYRNSFDFKALNSSLVVSAGLFKLYQVRYRFKPHFFGFQRQYKIWEEVNYQNFTQNYYGIGNHTLDSSYANLRQTRFNGSIDVQRRLSSKIFLGLRIQYQLDVIKNKNLNGSFPPGRLDFATRSGSTFWFAPTIIFDTRNFQNYADKGDYLSGQLLFAPSNLNSLREYFEQLSIDGRHYTRINKKQVIAYNIVAGYTLSPSIPFIFLNQLGGSQIMRGYYTGRYRDRNVLEMQAEYRYRFLPRVAATAFIATGQVFGIESFAFHNFKPDGGLGLRYVFDLPSRSTIRIDYGVGEKPRGQKRIGGFYLSVNEAF